VVRGPLPNPPPCEQHAQGRGFEPPLPFYANRTGEGGDPIVSLRQDGGGEYYALPRSAPTNLFTEKGCPESRV